MSLEACRPTLPGVLMLEAIAQLGAYAVVSDDRFAGKLPLFGGVEKARFRRQVLPGDTLELVGRLAAIVREPNGGARVDEADAAPVATPAPETA